MTIPQRRRSGSDDSRGFVVTINGEERRMSGLATPLIVVLAMPALVLVLFACFVVFAAAFLAIPAFCVAWIFARSSPSEGKRD